MPTYTNTVKHALRRLTGTNVISDIDAGIAALADDIDAIMASADAGTLASRPVSTAGTPGKLGRLYRVTDALNRIDFDYGTGWITVASAASPTFTDGITLVRDGAGVGLLHGRQSADTDLRFVLFNDGSLQWGPGNAGRDTILFRSAVGSLKTDGSLEVAGALTTKGGTAVALTNDARLANNVKTDDARLTDQRAPKGPETNLKIIRGNVTSTGTVQNGSGFTVAKTAAGQYTLTFSTAFASPPAVTLTVVGKDGAVAGLGAFPLAGSALVRVLDPAVLADAAFSFIAIGPA
jgi:hypothetical protein